MARRPAVVVALAVAFALGATPAARPPSAAAHARLVHAEPADGVSVASAPREVRLRFDEAISPRFRVVRLIDAHGQVVAGTALRGGPSPRELVLTLPPRLRRGAYDVTWEALAQDDGHVTGGATVFGVGTRAPAAARPASAPGTAVAPLSASLRSLDLALLCGLLGAVGMSALLGHLRWTGRAVPALVAVPQRWVRAAACAMAIAALVLGLGLLARQVHQLRVTIAPGTGVGDVLAVRWGELWIVRQALLAALVAALAPSTRGRARPGATAAGCALAVALVVVHALGGHAAAEPRPVLGVAVAAAHVAAAGVWMGGVAAFALALRAAGRRRAELARACRIPFAWAAAAAVAVLAVTGLIEAGAQVASIDALLTTDYGTTLLLKAGLVALTAALGAGSALVLRRGTPSRLLAVEAAAGLGILLAAAVLAASPPAKGPEFAPPRAVVAPDIVRHAGDLLVTTSVRPNRPGANVVSVLAVSSRRPPPAPVHDVVLRLEPGEGDATPPRTLPLSAVAPGRFVGGAQLDGVGPRRAEVLLTRAGRRVAVPVRWSVDAADPARPVVHSARRLAPVLDRVAAALAVAVLAAATGTARLRRGRARGSQPPRRTTSVARMPAP